jgi:GH18 family chitinase
MTFNVTDIDPHACTHLIYAFAGLDASTNKIISLDPKVDIEEGKQKRTV